VIATARDTAIAHVEALPIRVPFRSGWKIAGGAARMELESVIVRITTHGGITGIGETQAWRRSGSSETLVNLVYVIERLLAPALLGRSVFDLAALAHACDAIIDKSLYAKAAVFDALVDAKARALDVPAYELFGGRCRTSIPTCAIIPMKPTLEEHVDVAAAMVARGFRALTLKIGVDPSSDEKLVRLTRERLGDEIVLRADANAALGFDEALLLLKRLEPYGLDAVEQPIALWDLEGMAELARRSPIPLMADESLSTEHDLINVIRMRAASSIQTKIAKNGGMRSVHRLWTIAHAAGLRIYPGNHPSLSITIAAAAHVAAAWPHPLMDGCFAIGATGVLAGDVVTEPIVADGNAIAVSDRPGLGVDLDPAALAAFAAKD
jgi:muconate cycloisomerase